MAGTDREDGVGSLSDSRIGDREGPLLRRRNSRRVREEEADKGFLSLKESWIPSEGSGARAHS